MEITAFVPYTPEQRLDMNYLRAHGAHNCFGFTDDMIETIRENLNSHYPSCGSKMSRLHGSINMPKIDCHVSETLVFKLPNPDDWGWEYGACRARRIGYTQEQTGQKWIMDDLMLVTSPGPIEEVEDDGDDSGKLSQEKESAGKGGEYEYEVGEYDK